MSRRVLLAGLVGGVVLFLWGFLSHAVLKLGDAGLQPMPAAVEEPFVAAVRGASLPSGLYFVPGIEPEAMEDEEALAAWTPKLEAGPVAVVVLRAEGTKMMSPVMLGTEVLTDVVVSLLAALLLSCVGPRCGSYLGRVAFVAGLGLLTTIFHDVQAWNWFGFPCGYTVAQIADTVIGMTLVGLALAAIVKPRPAA